MLKSGRSGSVFSNVTPVARGDRRSNSRGTRGSGAHAASSIAVASTRMPRGRGMR